MPGAAHIAEFRSRGWTVLPGYLSPAELAALQRETADLANAPGLHPGCRYFTDRLADGTTGLVRVERVTDALAAFAGGGLLDRLARDAQAVLGGPVVLFKDKLNIRPPGSPGYAPHQDAARWRDHAAAFLSFGLFLSASDAMHGGFRFARFDPAQGLLPTATGDFDAQRFAALPQQDVTVQAWDALVIDGAAPHATTDNRSDARLLHLLVTFARSADPGVRDGYYAAQDRLFARMRTGNVIALAPT